MNNHKLIECLSSMIEEEIRGASEYMTHAMDIKATNPDAANLFADLAREEMKHANRLHELAATMMDAMQMEYKAAT
jgi:rubrerythrin